MLIAQKIASEIFEKHKEQCLDLLHDEDNFLKVVSEEYNTIIETARSQSMIVNPQMLRETQKVVDIKELQKQVTESLLQNLYIKKYINKGEYEVLLCQARKESK